MISRRRLLGVGAASVTAAALTPSWPAAFAADAPRLVLEPAPGTAGLVVDAPTPTPVWAYRGQVPGPVVRVRRGDTVRVRLTNGLPQPTTIHWHGVRIANAMDGVAGLTQDPVPPGGTFDYTFTVPDAGTYWYHPHFRSWEQLARGLYGLLVVDEDVPPAVDRDLFFVADDWRLTDDGTIDEASFGNLHEWAHAGRLGNFLTINGRSGPEIKVRAGERIRLRCVNVANARVLAFNFDRLAPRVIAVDGQPVPPADIAAGGLLLAPGQRTDLVIDVTGDAGSRIPVWEVGAGSSPFEAAAFVIADGPPVRSGPPATPVRLAPNPLLAPPSLGDAQGIELLMEGGAMGTLREAAFEGEVLSIRDLMGKGLVWAFNGVAGKPRKPLAVVPRGRTATINMVNRTRWPHAIHLHGHHFRVVERDRQPVAAAPWRDTELVAPDEQVRVAFVADNPGKWLLHCHMLEHQAAGMITWLEVA